MMTTELHRPIVAAHLSAQGSEHCVEAKAAECAAIAARLGLPAVESLTCRFDLRPVGETVHAEGAMRARVMQVCIVSLDEFAADIAEDFFLRFVPESMESAELDPEQPEDEVVFEGGVIDLGEAAVQQLALALDPYPRKPDAVLPDAASDASSHPFAALARLRQQR
jgi:uncharacterized metal-binding protein YceD (DUF177 family)